MNLKAWQESEKRLSDVGRAINQVYDNVTANIILTKLTINCSEINPKRRQSVVRT